MKTNKFFTLLALMGLSFVLVISACKKDDDDDNPNPGDQGKTPALEEKADLVSVPQAMMESSDPKAQEAVAMVGLMSSMTGYFSYFQPPEGATQVGTKSTNESWTWFDGEYYWYYTYSETGSIYYWEIKIGLSESEYYDFIVAEEAKDGQSGSIKIYYDAFYFEGGSIEDYYYEYFWEVNNDGDLMIDMEYYQGEDSYFKYHGEFRNDGSGELIYYIQGTKFYEMSWDASGSGQWKMYDEQGNLIDSGSW